MLQSAFMECYSLSILESLSANITDITTNVGGNLEVVKNNKNVYVYNLGDCKALSKIIKKIILGERSITYSASELIVKKYNLDRMVKEHFKIINI
jgi:L-malate glycosyltransferase